jgi:hypothetical protein
MLRRAGGRIADEEIERLKREVSLSAWSPGPGVELKRHGADLVVLCRSMTTLSRP